MRFAKCKLQDASHQNHLVTSASFSFHKVKKSRFYSGPSYIVRYTPFHCFTLPTPPRSQVPVSRLAYTPGLWHFSCNHSAIIYPFYRPFLVLCHHWPTCVALLKPTFTSMSDRKSQALLDDNAAKERVNPSRPEQQQQRGVRLVQCDWWTTRTPGELNNITHPGLASKLKHQSLLCAWFS